MEITVKKTIEETKVIQLPLFFISAEGYEYIGIFSETDLRIITNYKFSKDVRILKANDLKEYQKYFQEWMNPEKFTEISEQNFIEAWDNALRSLSFNSLAEAIPY